MINKENIAAAMIAAAMVGIAVLGLVRALEAHAEAARASALVLPSVPEGQRLVPRVFEGQRLVLPASED
ncbi:MAG TPA: hypothetical protein VHD89_02785 [Rhodanobacteraceae bacterium]|nr:hypothetical protein [Rhodanobacteraceae bacterium]